MKCAKSAGDSYAWGCGRSEIVEKVDTVLEMIIIDVFCFVLFNSFLKRA